jgi:hypothetical protein
MRLRLGIIVLLAFVCGALAACANTSSGGMTTMPGGQLPQVQAPMTPTGAPTATPASAQGLVSVNLGSTVTLPAPGDFKVSASWPASASPAASGSPAASATPASTASPVILNATVSVPGPPSIPAYGMTRKKGFLFSHRELGPVIVYVWFSSDKNVTLASLPTLDFTIPLSVLDPYGTDPDLRLAIYDPANEGKWTEGIAHRAALTPGPSPSAAETATATPTPTLTPTPTPTPTVTPTRPPGAPPILNTATPFGQPTPPMMAATQKPPVQTMQVRFVPEQRTMKLLAKKNLVFVLYAEPSQTETPSPSPSPSASAGATASATPTSSASPAPSPSGS